MARMPTVSSFGARPSGSTARSVIDFKTGEAELVAARGFNKLAAKSGELSATALKVSDAMGKQNIADARSDFLVGKIELDSRYKNDLDFETMGERYAADLEALKTKSSENLWGGGLADFNADTDVDIARGTAVRTADAWDKKRNFHLAKATATLEKNRNALMSTQHAGDRQSLLNSSKDTIDSMLAQGFLTEVEAEKLKRETAVSHAVSYVGSQPAHIQHELLGIPPGWSVEDPLPERRADPNNPKLADLIPQDMRVKMARQSMPAMNKRVAIDTQASLQAQYPDDVDRQLEAAKKLKNPTVRTLVMQGLKVDYNFAETRKKAELLGEAKDFWNTVSVLGDPTAISASIESSTASPELKEATQALADKHFSRTRAHDTEKRKQLKREAWEMVIKDESTENLTPEMRAVTAGASQAAMDRWVTRAIEGEEPVQDRDVWSKFITLPKEEFAKISLGQYHDEYRNDLDDIHFERGANMIRERDSTGERLKRSAVKAEQKRRSYADGNSVARAIANSKEWTKESEESKMLFDSVTAFVDDYADENDGRTPSRSELTRFLASQALRGEVSEEGSLDDNRLRGQAVTEGRIKKFYLWTEKDDLPAIAQVTGIPMSALPGVIKGLGKEENVNRRALEESYFGFEDGQPSYRADRLAKSTGLSQANVTAVAGVLFRAGKPLTYEAFVRAKRYAR